MPAKAVIDVDSSVSDTLLTLINQFPGFSTPKTVKFNTLSDTSGVGFYPASGASLLSDTESITGHVKQECLYPFNIVYRAAPKSEDQRLRIKEFLDTIGKWLERQPVIVNQTEHRIDKYPELASGNRVIKTISRTSQAYLNAAYQDGVEDWIISANLKYENEFDR